MICCQTLHEGLPGTCQYKYRNTASVLQYPNMICLLAFLFCIGKSNDLLSVYIYEGLIGAKLSPTHSVDNDRVAEGQNAAANK